MFTGAGTADNPVIHLLREQLRILKLQRHMTAPVRAPLEQQRAMQERLDRATASPLRGILEQQVAQFSAMLGWSPEAQRLQAEIDAIEAELSGDRPGPAAPQLVADQVQRPTAPTVAPVKIAERRKGGRPSQSHKIVERYVRLLFASKIDVTTSPRMVSDILKTGTGAPGKPAATRGVGEDAVRNALHDGGLGDKTARQALLSAYPNRVDDAVAVCLKKLGEVRAARKATK